MTNSTAYLLSNLKQEPKDTRDFTLAIPAGLTSNLPTRVDLRQYGFSESQENRNLA